MADTHKVVKNDTLSEIAVKYYKTYGYSDWKSYMNYLAKLNNIDNVNLIYIGQTLKLTGTIVTRSDRPTRPSIVHFGIQVGTDRKLFVTWYWKVPAGYNSNTLDGYEVTWEYRTRDAKGNLSIWFTQDPSKTTLTQSLYDAPENAYQVRVKVKPVSKTKETTGVKTTYYWSCEASGYKTKTFTVVPTAPNAPQLELKDDQLYAVSTIGLDTDVYGPVTWYKCEFQLYKDGKDTGTKKKVSIQSIEPYQAETRFTIDKTSAEYQVRCRLVPNSDSNNSSEWSPLSDKLQGLPEAPGAITECRATSKTSVLLKWEVPKTGILAMGYKIQYATNPRYFEGSDSVTTVSDIDQSQYEITNLESGKEYFFRVCARNLTGDSDWTDIVSVVLGSKASVPTTWSSSASVVKGESLTLFWVHNSEDNSRQSKAELEITVNGETKVESFETAEDAEDEDITRSYTVDTSVYNEGVEIKWRVRTMGVVQEFGDWSIQRTVTIYSKPTLDLLLKDYNGLTFSELESLPFTMTATHTPITQKVVGYHVSIIAKTAHEIVDETGTIKMVPANGEVYSKYVDTQNDLKITVSASDITLKNNIEYVVKCIASLDSGLTAEDSWEFIVAWGEVTNAPNAEIAIYIDSLTATIHPYCVDDDDNYIADTSLSVYRRGQDGSLVLIAEGINNDGSTTVTDPHPTLDYARYRIVARNNSTSGVVYNDLPGVEVGHKAVVIQWDEEWKSFDQPDTSVDPSERSWSGSMVKLPYNIEVTSDYQTDGVLANYIGRSYPVSYYGTQISESRTINTVVVKDDNETMYALERLAKWAGDAYVRLPSGAGFWAAVTINYGESYDALVIPITIKATRVEGGK